MEKQAAVETTAAVYFTVIIKCGSMLGFRRKIRNLWRKSRLDQPAQCHTGTVPSAVLRYREFLPGFYTAGRRRAEYL